ncbi:uncharacterized protein bcl3 [Mustelus asterias]
MCVNPSSVLPIERLASPRAMEGQACSAPLDLRLRRDEEEGTEEEEEEESLDSASQTGNTGRRVQRRLRPCGGPWPSLGRRKEFRPGSPEGAASEPTQGGAREGMPATPAWEAAGTVAATRVNGAVGKPGISLPPRKRPYTAEAEEKQAVPLKMAKPADSAPPSANHQGPVRLKSEPEDSFQYCDSHQHQLLSSPLPTANGYPYMEHLYVPYRIQLPCYTGANKTSLPPTSFPICPVPTHPIPVSPLPAFHPGPCLHTQRELLASDIAMATRQDEDGDTPLHIAVVQEDSTMVDKLIQLLILGKKDLDIYNNLRQTPLHLAVITKHSSIVRQLVTSGASRVLLDRNGQTAVHLACEHSSLECLQSLLAHGRDRIDLEIRNYDGYTPLHVAVNSCHREIAAYLLDQGADVDAVDIKSGRTPLVHAAESNHLDMVNLLLEHGANVNLQTYSGNTALHSSSGRGLMEIVKVLLKNGADSSIKNCHNDTSLMVAKNKKVIDILRGKASRSVAQSPSCQRLTSVIKECPSPNSTSNSPLSVPHGSSCSETSSHQKRSPQHLLTPSPQHLLTPSPQHLLAPSTRSPQQDSPSYPSSDSQLSCQRSPVPAAPTRSRSATPRPEGRPQPEEVAHSALEEREQPASQPYPWERTDRQGGGLDRALPTGTPAAQPVSDCPLGHPFAQIYCHGLVKHPLLPGASYPVLPFHQRYPGAEGAFLSFLGAPMPAVGPPAFVAQLPCPPHHIGAGPHAKENRANLPADKMIWDGWAALLHPQERPSSRNCDHPDVSTLSANSKGRGDS